MKLIYIALILAVLMITEVFSQPLNWEKLPYPKSAAIYSMAQDSAGAILIATPFGLYKSTDNLSSWQLVYLSQNFNLRLFVMSNGYIAAYYQTKFFISSDGGKSWFLPDSLRPNILFTNMIAGPGKQTFGVSLTTLYKYDPLNKKIEDIYTFTDETIQSLASDSKGGLYIATASGKMLLSQDTGKSWIELGNLNHRLNYFVVINNNIIGSDNSNGVVISCDRGQTWTSVIPGKSGATQVHVENIIPCKNNNILISTNFGLFESSDYGQTWSKIPGDYANGSYFSMFISREGNIYGTNNKVIIIGSDDLAHWNLNVPGITSTPISNFFITSANTIFASCEAGLYRTTDSGKKWEINIPVPQAKILFMTNNNKLVARSDNFFYISPDNGNTWKTMILDSVTSDFKSNITLRADSSGALYACQYISTYYYKSTDDGNTWVKENYSINKDIVFQEFAKDFSILEDGYNNIYIANGNKTDSILKADSFEKIAISPNGDVVLYPYSSGGGLLLRSKDKGKTWQKLEKFFDGTMGNSNIVPSFGNDGELYIYSSSSSKYGIFRNVEDSLFYRICSDCSMNFTVKDNIIYVRNLDGQIMRAAIPNEYPKMSFEVSSENISELNWGDTVKFVVSAKDNKNNPIDKSPYYISLDLDPYELRDTTTNGTGITNIKVPKYINDDSIHIEFINCNFDYVSPVSVINRVFYVRHQIVHKMEILTDKPDTIIIKQKQPDEYLEYLVKVVDNEGDSVAGAKVYFEDYYSGLKYWDVAAYDGTLTLKVKLNNNKQPGVYPLKFLAADKNWLDSDTLTKYIKVVESTDVFEEQAVPLVEIIPNPAYDMCTITLNNENAGETTIEVFDVFGNRIYELNKFSYSEHSVFKLNTSSLYSGIYYLKIEIGDKIINENIVVIH